MTQWEYGGLHHDFERKALTWTGPDGKSARPDEPDILSVMNRLGREGWELIAFAIGDYASIFYFKRPIGSV